MIAVAVLIGVMALLCAASTWYSGRYKIMSALVLISAIAFWQTPAVQYWLGV